MRTVGVLVLLAALIAWGPVHAIESDQEVARAVAERAHRAAVTKPGTRVCRLLAIGISERDWIRGTVVEAGPRDVGIRIDDPGRFPHQLNGTAVIPGAVVRDAPLGWTPC
jgi:hypothetical protein